MARSCTYNDAGAALPGALRHREKKKRLRLSLPPRLVGANEGGTDRPVCALPLSGSCRASTPKCTLHTAAGAAPSLPLLLLSRSPSFLPTYLPGVTKFHRARSRHPLSAGRWTGEEKRKKKKKKKKEKNRGTGARRRFLLSFSSLDPSISDARNMMRRYAYRAPL